MKKTLLATLFAALYSLSFSQIVIDTNYSVDVKTVVLAPLEVRIGDTYADNGEAITVSFDILGPQPAHLRYRLRHCNADWQPDELEAGEFLSGPAENSIDNYQSSFTTLTDYIHYEQSFPDRYSYFTASGNYIVEVFPQGDPDSILFVRRFRVYEDLVDIAVGIGKPSGANGNIYRDQEVNVGITPRTGSYLPTQENYYIVEVQQNRRDDNRRRLDFSGYSGATLRYDWSVKNVFAGGNNFRYFDLSNLRAAMYHVQRIEQWGGETFAFLQPDEDRSRKAYSQYNSLNGGMKVNIRDRQNPDIEADYVWVNFSLPMERPFLDGSVHIVGELTQWNLGDDSRMEWNSKYKAYTKRMQLKQGYYSYQLLFLPYSEQEALTATLEGDHFAMPNSYTVFVYYRSPGARYDRLVGLLRTTSIH
jgi:hypothetical protein